MSQTFAKEGSIVWKSIFGVVLLPIIAVIVIPYYTINYHFEMVDFYGLVLFIILTGLGITMGYHRLWAHRAFKTNFIVRLFLMIFSTAALQNSALVWASDHRKHHRFVDDKHKDPYAATRGFLFSHIGWLLIHNSKDVQEIKGVDDLKRDKMVMFQDKYYLILSIMACFGLPALVGWSVNRVVPFIIIAGLLRVILVHHGTFCINSLAHILGTQPYTTKNTARDSWITALVTMGEGYHNYHHLFAGDYRNGVRKLAFDPSKWLVWALSKIGWCYDLKRTPDYIIEIAQAKASKEQALLKQTADKSQIEEIYENFVEIIKTTYATKVEYLKAKKEHLPQVELKNFRDNYKNLKKIFNMTKKQYITTLTRINFAK